MDVGTGLSTTGVCCHNINDLFINNHSVGCLTAPNLQNESFYIITNCQHTSISNTYKVSGPGYIDSFYGESIIIVKIVVRRLISTTTSCNELHNSYG